MNNLKRNLRAHSSFLIMISINLLCCQGKVFILMNIYDWEKFNYTTLSEKEEFYSNLHIEDITDEDYMHGKRVFKDFEIKNIGEYTDLYLESDALLLAVVLKL